MACTVEVVDDIHAAIDHIHHHGRYILVSTDLEFSNLSFIGWHLSSWLLFLVSLLSMRKNAIVEKEWLKLTLLKVNVCFRFSVRILTALLPRILKLQRSSSIKLTGICLLF